MGFFDEIKRLAHPYDDEMEDDEEYEDDEYDDREEDVEEDEPAPPPPPRDEPPRRENYSNNDFPGAAQPRGNGKVVNIHTTAQLQVVLVKPERFENASDIADHLRDKRTVVLNLEKADPAIARRLLDFLSGVAYAQEGQIKKVAMQTYIVTPYNVDIMGDLIDELENNGLYF